MDHPPWVPESRKHILCVDTYQNGVLQGSFHAPCHDALQFSSLSQFLIGMEEQLDRRQTPQAYTSLRRFAEPHAGPSACTAPIPCGCLATFELQVIFRQHSSWQGTLLWREKKLSHSFRSVLELVVLLDSALRSMEGSGAA